MRSRTKAPELTYREMECIRQAEARAYAERVKAYLIEGELRPGDILIDVDRVIVPKQQYFDSVFDRRLPTPQGRIPDFVILRQGPEDSYAAIPVEVKTGKNGKPGASQISSEAVENFFDFYRAPSGDQTLWEHISFCAEIVPAPGFIVRSCGCASENKRILPLNDLTEYSPLTPESLTAIYLKP
ncbi:MAG: hypothetical protein V1820_05515 [archaeon]